MMDLTSSKLFYNTREKNEGSTWRSSIISYSAYNEVFGESIGGDLNWQVEGQAYYSLSSMTAYNGFCSNTIRYFPF